MGVSSSSDISPVGSRSPANDFEATHWSLVITATGKDSLLARRALADLCAAYWYPLYAFVRRLGYSAHDAEDATQGFLADLLERQALGTVDREKGRFRSFLIASMKNFLAHDRDRARAAKRGGGQLPVPLDACAAEERYRLEPLDLASPDKLFDRRWALTVLDRALVRLKAEFEANGRGALFTTLAPVLTAHTTASYSELAAHLGMSEGAVKVAVHRLRQRYRAALREEIAQTVTSPAEIDTELRHLLDALGS